MAKFRKEVNPRYTEYDEEDIPELYPDGHSRRKVKEENERFKRYLSVRAVVDSDARHNLYNTLPQDEETYYYQEKNGQHIRTILVVLFALVCLGLLAMNLQKEMNAHKEKSSVTKKSAAVQHNYSREG